MDENHFPRKILWAWERPEDLQFIDTREFAVAFLAQTLTLKGNEVVFNPRHQPLKVPADAKLIAVTRIEGRTTSGTSASQTGTQREKLVDLILRSRDLDHVSAIQIDFDAAVSERDFYSSLLRDLRRQLPDKVPLSMTALASFCVGDRWLTDLPVDEAVPMVFRMGADDRPIKSLLARGHDFTEPICRRSYGIAVDEPLSAYPDDSRRVYVFNVRAWTKEDVAKLQKENWK